MSSQVVPAGPIENVVVMMFERRSYDELLGALYDSAHAAPHDVAPAGQLDLDGLRIADTLDPSDIPITAYLANRFMVCDRWFASTPGQRFANRMFAHCCAPGGVVVDGQPVASYARDDEYALAWGSGLALEPNLFSALDAAFGERAGRGGARLANWKVYFHDYSVLANLLRYVAECSADPNGVNVANYDECDYPPGLHNPIAHPTTTFLQDVAQGTLPPYAVIEPRYTTNFPGAAPNQRANSNRGGVWTDPIHRNDGTAVHLIDGEHLLLEVYLALRQSRYWNRVLLIVTYDENGDRADHVVPPRAAMPGSAVRPTLDGFAFDRYGGRVPAIVVSPYVRPGTRLSADGASFDHSSIVKTVWECFRLRDAGAASLNERDAAASSILPSLASTIVNEPLRDPMEPANTTPRS